MTAVLAIEAPDHARTAAAARRGAGPHRGRRHACPRLRHRGAHLPAGRPARPPSLQRRSALGFPRRLYAQMVRELFENPEWVEPLWVTIEIGVIVAALCMAAATLLGRALPRMGRRAQILADRVPAPPGRAGDRARRRGLHVLPHCPRHPAGTLVDHPRPLRLGATVRPPRYAGGDAPLRSPPRRGGGRSRRLAVAPVLGHRAAADHAGHRHGRFVRLHAVDHRAAADAIRPRG